MTNTEAMHILISSDRIWANHTDEEKRALNMAIVSLEKTQWIPVTEELPEENANVLMSVSWGGVVSGLYIHGRWYPIGRSDALSKDYIVAWQPCPEPYGGGDPDA
jgi:hypothetical protein